MMERGECNGGEGKLCDGEGRTTYDGEMKREREKKYIYIKKMYRDKWKEIEMEEEKRVKLQEVKE